MNLNFEGGMKEVIESMPEKSKGGRFLVEFAQQLFVGKTVRFCHTPLTDELPEGLKVIVNESLTLFFHKRGGAWKYEGWELGDYNGYWTNGAI